MNEITRQAILAKLIKSAEDRKAQCKEELSNTLFRELAVLIMIGNNGEFHLRYKQLIKLEDSITIRLAEKRTDVLDANYPPRGYRSIPDSLLQFSDYEIEEAATALGFKVAFDIRKVELVSSTYYNPRFVELREFVFELQIPDSCPYSIGQKMYRHIIKQRQKEYDRLKSKTHQAQLAECSNMEHGLSRRRRENSWHIYKCVCHNIQNGNFQLRQTEKGKYEISMKLNSFYQNEKINTNRLSYLLARLNITFVRLDYKQLIVSVQL